MNQVRRKRIADMVSLVVGLKSEIEVLRDEEKDAFDELNSKESAGVQCGET